MNIHITKEDEANKKKAMKVTVTYHYMPVGVSKV